MFIKTIPCGDCTHDSAINRRDRKTSHKSAVRKRHTAILQVCLAITSKRLVFTFRGAMVKLVGLGLGLRVRVSC